MRRSLSILSAAVMAATTLVALTNAPVSAAPSDVSIIRSTTSAPASISAATAVRAERLYRSNQMLVVGRDQSTAGSRLHVWKINDDLSIDNTFGAIDLGANFAAPTAADSFCVASNDSYCSNLDAFIVNEVADRFVVVMNKPIMGTGQNYSYDTFFRAIGVGKISTGEILASVLVPSNTDSSRLQAGWSNVNYVELGQSTCTSTIGATLNGVALQSTWLHFWGTAIRPDGSLTMSLECRYSNIGNGSLPSSVVEYTATVLATFKPSGSSLVIDTTFGSNGHVVVFNDVSKCTQFMPNQSYNAGITSMTSTAVFMPYLLTTTDRVTTVPNHLANNGVTSYDGCENSGPNQQNESTSLVAYTVTGAVKNTTVLGANADIFVQRWIVDPSGNWNATTFIPPANMQAQPTTAWFRLTKDGVPDSTNGTNGLKSLSLPSSLTINGTTVSMNYRLEGYVTTASTYRFTGFASSMAMYNCTNGQANMDVTRTYYPYYLTADGELVTSYGDGGLGAAFSFEVPRTHLCGVQQAATKSFINSAGKHVVFTQTVAIGSQATGLVMATWDPAADVIGGGDGSGVDAAAASGRTDSKVYSRRLPTRTEVNTSLNVLTKKMSRTQMLRTRTPKVCVNLSRSVLVVKTGTCRLEIVDKSTKQVVRRLSTRVRSTEQAVGTTVNAQDSIRFKQVSTRLSRSAKSQIAELAEAAAEAKRVILVGHTAALTENTVSNNRIALQRAARVKAELRKQFKAAGVKVPISIVSVGPSAPLTTKRTEASQARNRRVEIYIMP